MIDATKWYKPSEISEKGWITNSTRKAGYTSYIFLLRLIESGRLKAQNESSGNVKPRWKVKGEEILRFRSENPTLQMESNDN